MSSTTSMVSPAVTTRRGGWYPKSTKAAASGVGDGLREQFPRPDREKDRRLGREDGCRLWAEPDDGGLARMVTRGQSADRPPVLSNVGTAAQKHEEPPLGRALGDDRLS